MSWVVKNNMGRVPVKIRKFAWTSDVISQGGEYKSDWEGWGSDGGLDITVEGVSGLLLQFLMNPTLIATTVHASKNTRIELNDGSYDRVAKTFTVRIHVTDNKGRDESTSTDVYVKW